MKGSWFFVLSQLFQIYTYRFEIKNLFMMSCFKGHFIYCLKSHVIFTYAVQVDTIAPTQMCMPFLFYYIDIFICTSFTHSISVRRCRIAVFLLNLEYYGKFGKITKKIYRVKLF